MKIKSILLALVCSLTMFGQTASKWMPSFVGFSTDPTNISTNSYTVNGYVVHVEAITTSGTSSQTQFLVSLPFPAMNTMSVPAEIVCDNNIVPTSPGRVDVIAGSNIAVFYKTSNGGLWTASGNKGARFTFDYMRQSLASTRQVIWQGNSLSACSQGNVNGGKRYPQTCYSNMLASGMTNVDYVCYAINGKSTTQHLSGFATEMRPWMKTGDVVCFWELTVDISVNHLSAQQAYDNYAAYSDSVHACGGKCVVLTMIARNNSADPSYMEARRDSVNALILANSTQFDLIVDVGAKPEFDDPSDCSNTTYYNSDKIHLTDAGYNLIAGYVSVLLYPYIQSL